MYNGGMDSVQLSSLTQLIRYYILTATTNAGSGHPTSSLSATDLMTTLFFGGYLKYDPQDPDYHNNDRVIFSKGHASPLFYALWAAAGEITDDELMKLRDFDSPLEGHPTMRFKHTEAATGSLGQGLSVGFGMALNAKHIDKLPYTTYVLLGDSEMAEGQVWEAMELAAYYNLNNLVAILDANRLGQRGETMYGHDIEVYDQKATTFGWNTIVIDGHNLDEIKTAFSQVESSEKPTMIIAKTIKGKGVSFLENEDGWHGKALDQQQLDQALDELGTIDTSLKATIALPVQAKPQTLQSGSNPTMKSYEVGESIATRKTYGSGLVKLISYSPDVIVLDAEVSNSTYSEDVKKHYPDHFFEMFIAEQNMISAAVGLAKRGKKPYVSTFAAFFSRAYDQIRMAQYSETNLTLVGSHAGISMGEDGSSQMGLEDIAMMRAIRDSVVLYPSDAITTEKAVELAYEHKGIVYIRTSRPNTPVLYSDTEEFQIGGSKTLHESDTDVVTVISAGVTLHEALKAYEILKQDGISIRIIDLYSVKPLDTDTITKAAQQTKAIITVEDHYPAGGLGEAVMHALSHNATPVYSLAVDVMPRSGSKSDLLAYAEIDSSAIVKRVKSLLN